MVCGYRVVTQSYAEVRDQLIRRIQNGEGARMVTLNVEMVARAQREASYKEILNTADIIVPDGMPVVWASRKRQPNKRKIQRITGVELTQDLCLAIDGNKIGIVGGKDPMKALEMIGMDSREQVAINNERLEATEADYARVAEQMKGRTLIFLALGVPKQDLFAIELRKRVPEATLIPNGGTFELLAGFLPRAPEWMQSAGLEWLFRLCVEPRRLWKRYLVEYWSGVTALIFDSFRSKSTNS